MLDTNANADWLAHCTEIKDLATALSQHSSVRLHTPALLLIAGGQTKLSINGHEEHIAFGHLLVVEKDSVLQVTPSNHFDFWGYLLSFQVYTTNLQSMDEGVTNHTRGYDVQMVREAVVAHTQAMLAEAEGQPTTTMKQYLLYHLLKEWKQERQIEEYTLEQRMQSTVIFMQQKFSQTVTRDELAAIAGYSPAYYSRKFAQLYQQTPIEYLIRYRILRAKEMLLTTDATSKHVAKKAGFEDAQYFNRQFKRVVGSPPKQFKNTIAKQRLCFLSTAQAEIAMALGIVPACVAITPSLLPAYQKEIFEQHGVTLLEMPQYVLREDRVVEQQPDVIIGEHLAEDAKLRLQQIAPIILRLPFEFYDRIDFFGRLFDKQQQAKQLIEKLAEEVQVLKNNIHHHIDSGSTVLYLRVEKSGYRYAGEASIDSAILLYKGLGLQMPENFRANERTINGCSIQQLADANPTYLFIEKRTMDFYSADLSLSMLQSSDVWTNLEAVKNKRVYEVETGLWVNNCSVFGKRRIMKQIEEALLE